MTEPIRINRSTTRKPKPKDADLGFGQIFTDHMFLADFQEEKGWYDPRVAPAVRAALARPGHRGPALRPGDLRRPQGVPRGGRQDPPLPAPEARGADDQ